MVEAKNLKVKRNLTALLILAELSIPALIWSLFSIMFYLPASENF